MVQAPSRSTYLFASKQVEEAETEKASAAVQRFKIVGRASSLRAKKKRKLCDNKQSGSEDLKMKRMSISDKTVTLPKWDGSEKIFQTWWMRFKAYAKFTSSRKPLQRQ